MALNHHFRFDPVGRPSQPGHTRRKWLEADLSEHLTAVYVHHLASHLKGFIGAEENRCIRDFLRLDDPAQW